VAIIKFSEQFPETKAGRHICAQILRSGTSAAPNYGEAQSAESRVDFINKLKIALKELRETEIWLKIIIKAELIQRSEEINSVLKETDDLISILFKSIDTAKKINKYWIFRLLVVGVLSLAQSCANPQAESE